MKIAALILAAGKNTRFKNGGRAKTLAILDGKPLLEHISIVLREFPSIETFVITGNDAEAVAAEAGRLKIIPIHNPGYAAGMMSSLKVGIRHVVEKGDINGILIFLGDMPNIRSETVRVLLAEFSPTALVRPTYQEFPGHPTYFGEVYFEEILAEPDGDRGAAPLFRRHQKNVREIPVPDPGILFDIDTLDDLSAPALER